MNANCNIVDDLLPLYVDGSCTEESRILVGEHLKECPACREKLHRMQSDRFESSAQAIDAPQFANYAKKVQRHRLRIGILVTLGAIVSALLLFLITLTVMDMRRQASPTVYPVEDGVYNLTSAALHTTSEDIGQYLFFTNSTQIGVTIQADEAQTGAVTLWDASADSGYIQIYQVDGFSADCTFRNLSASHRYRIICDGLTDVAIVVTDARTVSFWHSLGSVLDEIFYLLFI